MFTVESTDPYSEHPHITDEKHPCEVVDDAAAKFAELTGWSEDDARDALAEGDITHTDPETGREVTARRVPSPAERLLVQKELARVEYEVAAARVRVAWTQPPEKLVELVQARDDAEAVAQELGVFDGVIA